MMLRRSPPTAIRLPPQLRIVGELKESRKPVKSPADQISEEQCVKLKRLLGEIMELDAASYGSKLSEGQLRQKWWGALAKVVPNTTYKNYSQARYRRAMKWLRSQRARLIAGAAKEAPELSRHAGQPHNSRLALQMEIRCGEETRLLPRAFSAAKDRAALHIDQGLIGRRSPEGLSSHVLR